ncbi:MAG: hypothetical protein P8Y03_24380, partial [Anaerolineales bacterium]
PGSVGLRTPRLRRSAASATFWFLLATAPLWLSHVGGYTQLASGVHLGSRFPLNHDFCIATVSPSQEPHRGPGDQQHSANYPEKASI